MIDSITISEFSELAEKLSNENKIPLHRIKSIRFFFLQVTRIRKF